MWTVVTLLANVTTVHIPAEGVVWGPSAVGVDVGRHTKRFGRPVAMTPAQIDATVRQLREPGDVGSPGRRPHGHP